jgi:hypothetical protein
MRRPCPCPPSPGIVAHEVLEDRRRILPLDSRGHVALWDVLAGAPIAQYGAVRTEPHGPNTPHGFTP